MTTTIDPNELPRLFKAWTTYEEAAAHGDVIELVQVATGTTLYCVDWQERAERVLTSVHYAGVR
jgi:hypothetical protein